jgi:hypothetical protein
VEAARERRHEDCGVGSVLQEDGRAGAIDGTQQCGGVDLGRVLETRQNRGRFHLGW